MPLSRRWKAVSGIIASAALLPLDACKRRLHLSNLTEIPSWAPKVVLAAILLCLGLNGVMNHRRGLWNLRDDRTVQVEETDPPSPRPQSSGQLETLLARWAHTDRLASRDIEIARLKSSLKSLETALGKAQETIQRRDITIAALESAQTRRALRSLVAFRFVRHTWKERDDVVLIEGTYWVVRKQGSSKQVRHPVEDMDQFRCTICIQSFEEGEDTVALPCEHRFHKDCVFAWLQKNFSCPRCTRRIALKPITEDSP